MARDRLDGVLILADAIFYRASHAPGRTGARSNACRRSGAAGGYLDAGGLASFQGDFAELFRRSASLIDKILQGHAAGRNSVRAVHQVRTGAEPEGRPGAGAEGAAERAGQCRRGDRMITRRGVVVGAAAMPGPAGGAWGGCAARHPRALGILWQTSAPMPAEPGAAQLCRWALRGAGFRRRPQLHAGDPLGRRLPRPCPRWPPICRLAGGRDLRGQQQQRGADRPPGERDKSHRHGARHRPGRDGLSTAMRAQAADHRADETTAGTAVNGKKPPGMLKEPAPRRRGRACWRARRGTTATPPTGGAWLLPVRLVYATEVAAGGGHRAGARIDTARRAQGLVRDRRHGIYTERARVVRLAARSIECRR